MVNNLDLNVFVNWLFFKINFIVDCKGVVKFVVFLLMEEDIKMYIGNFISFYMMYLLI